MIKFTGNLVVFDNNKENSIYNDTRLMLCGKLTPQLKHIHYAVSGAGLEGVAYLQ